MTREEAIQYIDGLHCEEDFPYTDAIADFVKERNEAIDMAIEALSADNEALQAKVRHQADRVNALLEENTNLRLDVDNYKSKYETACLIIDTNHEMIQTYTKIFKMQEAELQKLRKEALDV